MLAEQLKTYRIKNNLKQKELADILKISSATYNTYERGISEPPLDVLCKIADVFGVSLDELAGRTQKEWSFTRDDLLDKINNYSKMLSDKNLCLLLGRMMAMIENQEEK